MHTSRQPAPLTVAAMRNNLAVAVLCGLAAVQLAIAFTTFSPMIWNVPVQKRVLNQPVLVSKLALRLRLSTQKDKDNEIEVQGFGEFDGKFASDKPLVPDQDDKEDEEDEDDEDEDDEDEDDEYLDEDDEDEDDEDEDDEDEDDEDEDEYDDDDDNYLESYNDEDFDDFGLLDDRFSDDTGNSLFNFVDAAEFDVNYKKLEELKALDDARLADDTPSQMDLNLQKMRAAREAHRIHEKDTGSAQYQIAQLTERIKYLTVHMINNKYDISSRRGLVALVNKRRTHLDFLKSRNPEACSALVTSLGIRYKFRGDRFHKPTKYGAFKNTKNKKARNLNTLDHVVVQR